MNSTRRKKIQYILNKIKDYKSELTYLADEEQDAIDNVPENLQFSDKMIAMEDSLSDIEDAIESLSDAIDSLNDV